MSNFGRTEGRVAARSARAPNEKPGDGGIVFRDALPAVIEAAYRYWQAIGAIVPLELLIEVGVRQLREAADGAAPLALDFATPLCAFATRAAADTRRTAPARAS